jgi:hypothetical protein
MTDLGLNFLPAAVSDSSAVVGAHDIATNQGHALLLTPNWQSAQDRRMAGDL